MLAMMPTLVSADDAIRVTINGEAVAFQGQDPIMVDGRVLIPVSFVFRDLGFVPVWDRPTQTATLTSDDYEIVLVIGESEFTVNGVQHELDVPAQLIGGRTMVPMGPILRSIGIAPTWSNADRLVAIAVPETEDVESKPLLLADNIIPHIEVELAVFEYGRVIEGVTMILTDVYDRVHDSGKFHQAFVFAPTGTVTFSRDIPILVYEAAPDRPYGYTYKYVYYRTFRAGVEYPISDFQRETEWGLTWLEIMVFDLNILNAEDTNQRLYETNENIGPSITFIGFEVATEQTLEWLYHDRSSDVPLADLVDWRVPISINLSLVYVNDDPDAQWEDMFNSFVFALYEGEERISVANPNILPWGRGATVGFASFEDIVDDLTIRIVENPYDMLIELLLWPRHEDFDTLTTWGQAVDAQQAENPSDRMVFDLAELRASYRMFEARLFIAPR